jgi:uncharacterized protein YndB with AHSA1/START domain
MMLDLVKERPGMTVSDLASHFAFTRYAVLKHLRVLEDAGLIVRRRNGKTKELYLNAIPIQSIYDRWLSQYSARWASRLTALKYELEKEEPMKTETKLQQVYVLYIRSTPAKVWDAIVKPEMTRQYFYGTEIESDLKPGSSLDYFMKNEKGETVSALTGKILEVVPGKKLVHTFSFPQNDDKPSRAFYEIERVADQDLVKLTVIHDEFEGETKTYKDTSGGWPILLNSLKTLLETGEPLPTHLIQ